MLDNIFKYVCLLCIKNLHAGEPGRGERAGHVSHTPDVPAGLDIIYSSTEILFVIQTI